MFVHASTNHVLDINIHMVISHLSAVPRLGLQTMLLGLILHCIYTANTLVQPQRKIEILLLQGQKFYGQAYDNDFGDKKK